MQIHKYTKKVQTQRQYRTGEMISNFSLRSEDGWENTQTIQRDTNIKCINSNTNTDQAITPAGVLVSPHWLRILIGTPCERGCRYVGDTCCYTSKINCTQCFSLFARRQPLPPPGPNPLGKKTSTATTSRCQIATVWRCCMSSTEKKASRVWGGGRSICL